MLSYCLETNFLDGVNSEHILKISKCKIERKIQDLLNMLKSEAWQNDFQQAMETFPVLQDTRISRKDGCEACARQGRIASEMLEFTGTPYDMRSFESQEVSQSKQMSFEVGKHCARRSKLYHRVFHYEYHLREECVEAINQYSDNDVTTDVVLDKCMEDERWKEEKYIDFCSLSDEVTRWFAAVNKSQNK